MDPDTSGSLEEQVGELRLRVRRLEEALQRRGVVLPGVESPPIAAHGSAAPPRHPALATRHRLRLPMTALWLAVAFAGFYLLLLRMPARGMVRTGPAVLSALHLTTAVVFLTIAIPLKAEGRWLTIGWLAEGAALLWAALVRVIALLGVVALRSAKRTAKPQP